jgi:VanZ family protein
VNQDYTARGRIPWFHSPVLHAIMYSFLLVATPFILLRNYLVQAISLASSSSFVLFGQEIKIIPALALAAVVILAIIFRRQITRARILAIVLVLILNALAQQVTDFYLDHKFYDLQQNWHYFAYALYTYMIYRALKNRDLPLHKIMLITYFSAAAFSTFDEFFQRYMSSRVFDICDIGKDVYGVYLGMILVYICGGHSQVLLKDLKNIRHRRLRDYYRHPGTLLLLMFVLSFAFLGSGSILTDAEYAFAALGVTFLAFLLFIAILHFSQFLPGKIIIISILTMGLMAQGYFYINYRHGNITHTRYGLTIYRGICVPFFDFMIFPDGKFRLVDKKHYFNLRDRKLLLKKKPDIIIIASGAYGLGGKGFTDPKHDFIYNPFTKKATQLIIQKNAEATKTFNRLKNDGKNVLLVLHNTC